MFSEKPFIKASRDFVCVRLETFENSEHEQLVRKILNGRFANTAFVLLAPDGETTLSRSGRGPHELAGPPRRDRESRDDSNSQAIIAAMKKVANQFKPTGSPIDATLQDFHTFRQALNVASGDQRLLLAVSAPASERATIESKLKPLFSQKDIIGRFHLDFTSSEVDAKWAKKIEGVSEGSAFVIVQADRFGQSGKAVAQLPLDASAREIHQALLAANAAFAKSETRKVYSEHVKTGREERVYFENEIPYGEDRDGDGKIDPKPHERRRR